MLIHHVSDSAGIVLRRRVLGEEAIFRSRVHESVLYDQSAFSASYFAVFVINDDVAAALVTNCVVNNQHSIIIGPKASFEDMCLEFLKTLCFASF